MNATFENFINQLKQSGVVVEVATSNMSATTAFLQELENGLSGEQKEAVSKLKTGVNNLFEEAKNGNMNFNNSLNDLKKEMSKYTNAKEDGV